MTAQSPAEHLVARLAQMGPYALQALREMQVDPMQEAALAHDWEDFWARPQQLPPDHPWRSWGAFGGRGGGKTRANAEFINREVADGRAKQIALIAQNEDKVWETMIENPKSGLIATSPPWFRARPLNGELRWPNGALARVFTPERPDDIFGPEHDLAWVIEIHAWPRASMSKAFSNLRFGLRLGYGRMLWESNPRKRHPLLKMLIERSMRAPQRHVISQYTTFDNKANLTPEAIEDWIEEYGGTRAFEEMLMGKQFDDDEEALFRQEWFDKNRRHMPTKLKRRILSIDPAISMREGTDATGMVEAGTALDDQILAIDDFSERVSVEVWSRTVVRRYFAGKCDCCIVERNRGGDMPVAMLRAACEELDFSLIVLPLESNCPGYCPDVMHVKEVVSRQSKEVRAEGASPLVERGRVSHVIGADLNALEEECCTWIPAPKAESPNRLDAYVHALWELGGLWGKSGAKGKTAFRGMERATELIRGQAPGPVRVAPTGTTADLLAKLGRGSGWSGGL